MGKDMLDIINAAFAPIITEFVGVIVTVLVGCAVKLLRDKTGIEIEVKDRDALHMALNTGAQLALTKMAGASTAERTAATLEYAVQSVPDAIKRLKPTGSVLNDLATAKLQSIMGGK